MLNGGILSKRNPKHARRLAKAHNVAQAASAPTVHAEATVDLAAQQALIKLAVESWRFSRTVARSMARLEPSEASKIDRQFRWFSKQVEESLQDAGLKLVNLEGQAYDVGDAATPLNLDDFEPGEDLVIAQMIEPVIMGINGLLATGTVMLGKAE